MSATNRGAVRLASDDYQTPLWVVHGLLQRFQWDGLKTFHEPCRGAGHITQSLPGHIRKSYCEISEGKDYLKYRPRKTYDLIATNPPFSLAMDFLQKSLVEAHTVAYLLRLNFLGCIDRAHFWMHNAPDYVWVIYPRPSFVGRTTDATEYAWFVWDRGGHVKPVYPPVGVITHSSAPTKKRPLPSHPLRPKSSG